MNNPDQPRVYQILIKGHLDNGWNDWFDGVTITLQDDGTTLLRCHVVDQAALHSLLREIRDLGLPLISVNAIEPNDTDPPDDHTL